MYKISHIQYKVKNIEEGIEQFKKLGFQVERGGAKAMNAFIWFEEGPFLEIFEMPRYVKFLGLIFGVMYGKAMKYRWDKWYSSELGFIDFAIEPLDIAKLDVDNFYQIRPEIKEKGFNPTKIIKWSRKNLKDEKIRFSYMPVLPSSLPFFVSAYDKNQKPEKIAHPNGAYKIKEVLIHSTKTDVKNLNEWLVNDNLKKIEIGDSFFIRHIILEGKEKEKNFDLPSNIIVDTFRRNDDN